MENQPLETDDPIFFFRITNMEGTLEYLQDELKDHCDTITKVQKSFLDEYIAENGKPPEQYSDSPKHYKFDHTISLMNEFFDKVLLEYAAKLDECYPDVLPMCIVFSNKNAFAQQGGRIYYNINSDSIYP